MPTHVHEMERLVSLLKITHPSCRVSQTAELILWLASLPTEELIDSEKYLRSEIEKCERRIRLLKSVKLSQREYNRRRLRKGGYSPTKRERTEYLKQRRKHLEHWLTYIIFVKFHRD